MNRIKVLLKTLEFRHPTERQPRHLCRRTTKWAGEKNNARTSFERTFRVENFHLTRVENQGIYCSVLLVNRSPLVEAHLDHSIVNKSFDDFTSESTDLVLGVEHPDLSSDPATCQDVGLLVVQGEGGPGKRVEVLLDVLVLVLHQDRPGVDVDDADAVSSAGGHVRSCLVVVFRVRFKDNLKQ